MSSTLTNLSYSAIRSLCEEKDESLPIIIQVLEETECELKSADNKFAQFLLNDGYTTQEFIIALNFDLRSIVKQQYHPIIKILEVRRKGNYTIITKFELLDPSVKEKIGKPIDFQEFKKMNYTNPNGNNEIVKSKAAYQIKLNSTKKVNIKVEQANENANNNSQPKSGFKLSLNPQKSNPQKQAVQKIESNYQNLLQPIAKIEDLYPGIKGFKLKGRVITKSEITQFKSGQGQFFKIDIMDSDAFVIGAAFFNSACTKFYNIIEKGKVYTFETGTIKTNKYTSKTQNMSQYQITFEDYSQIREVEDDSEIKQQALSLKTIDQIEDSQIDSFVDLLGVVSNLSKPYQITTKNSNEQKTKRVVTVFDDSMKGIEITFWGEMADKLDFQPNQIAAFKGLRVTEYQGKRGLSASIQTMIEKNVKQLQEINRYHEIVEFLEQNQDKIEQTKETKIKQKLSYIEQIEKEFENITNLKFTKFFEVRGYITFIQKKTTIYYESCQFCFKKVVQQNKLYFCQPCQKQMDQPLHRFILNVKISDCTGSVYVSLSNDLATQLLNCSADKFSKQLDNQKEQILNEATHKQYRFLVLGKMEEYNGQIRHRYQIINIIQNNYLAECQQLYNQINEVLKLH